MLTIGSLCSGYGGLDLAVEAVFGARTIWHAEKEAAPSKVLAARWPGVRNHGDITSIGWDAWRADILTAGYPCQPFSLAGARKGTDDERHLWPAVAEAVRRIRPRYVFLENVPGHRSMGFDAVLADLAAMRYVGSWRSLRASDIGAPHGRERVFILARDSDSVAWTPAVARERRPGPVDQPRTVKRALRSVGLPVPDPDSDAVRQQQVSEPGSGETPIASWRSEGSAAHAHDDGLEIVGRELTVEHDADRRGSADIAWGKYEPAIRRWEAITGRTAPYPRIPAPLGGEKCAPRFVEWMQGLSDGWVTDVPGITDDEALTMLGNGVVPQQAAHALRLLLATQAVAA